MRSQGGLCVNRALLSSDLNRKWNVSITFSKLQQPQISRTFVQRVSSCLSYRDRQEDAQKLKGEFLQRKHSLDGADRPLVIAVDSTTMNLPYLFTFSNSNYANHKRWQQADIFIRFQFKKAPGRRPSKKTITASARNVYIWIYYLVFNDADSTETPI
jgi:hypothetical protein